MSNDAASFIPLSVPHIRGRELEYVSDCIRAEWVSSAGPFVDRFEKEFAQYVGAKYAIACASGTSALHVALLLAGVKPGDEVIVPTITFIASVNAIQYCGASPVFFDSDEYYNLDANQVIHYLRHVCIKKEDGIYNPATQRRVAAVLPVHVFGNAVDLQALVLECEALNIPLVEDAAESLGTRYRGTCKNKHTGTVGSMGAFSFNGNKIITTGGGGMLVTDNEALAKKAKYLTTQAKDDEVRFIHDEVGFNYRMTNVQAAIGVAQLEQMPAYLEKKKNLFQKYSEALRSIAGLRVAPVPTYAENNHWMFALQVDAKKYGEDREQILQRLHKAKIQTRPLWLPNHRQKPYQAAEKREIATANLLWEITLNIPCSIGMSEKDQDRVIQELSRDR